MKMAEAPLTLSEATALSAEVHGSLQLYEVLRACRRTLAFRLPVGRLNLAELRANEFSVTLCSLDGGEETPLVGPLVIELEASRLRDCITEKKYFEANLAGLPEQDSLERKHLLHPQAGGVVYLPLLLKGKLKGFLIVELVGRGSLDALQRSYLAFVADHVAQAIENSDAHYIERRRVRQLSVIRDIAKLAVIQQNLKEFLGSASELVRMALDYQFVQIWIAASKDTRLEPMGHAAKESRPEAETRPVPSMVEQCRKEDRILCSNSPSSPDITDSPGRGGSRLAVPIRLRGESVGILWVESDRLDAFSAEDLNVMDGVASLIAAAFDNLRNLENAQFSNEYMHAILQSAKDLAILWTDMNGYVITSSVGTQQVFGLSENGVGGRDILSLFTNPGFQRDLAQHMSNQNSPTLERAQVLQSTNDTDRFIDISVERVSDPGKNPIGFLCIVRDVTENVILYQTLESLSITDELTGLFNQRHFSAKLAAEIERTRRFKKKLSICFFDLDGFKKFNDGQGHVQGDQVLRDTARLMRSQVRDKVDSCFRYGGDEFVIILPETAAQNAVSVAERLRSRIIDFFMGQISASIGLAEYEDTLDAASLLKKADKAMYASKAAGGNSVVIAE